MKIAKHILEMTEGVEEDTEARSKSIYVFNLLWKKFKACVLERDRDFVASVYISKACEEPLEVVGNKHVEVALDAEGVVPGCGLQYVRFVVSNSLSKPHTSYHHCGRGGTAPHIIEVSALSADPLNGIKRGKSLRDRIEASFVHEYTHFQDSVRGSVSDTVSLYNEKGRKAYLSTPQEFNAWFQTAVHRYTKEHRDLPGSFKEFRRQFIETTGYPRDDMEEVWQRKFDRRLSKLYLSLKGREGLA